VPLIVSSLQTRDCAPQPRTSVSRSIVIGFTNSFGHFDEADFLIDEAMAYVRGN
jgi:hypothetical protein